MSKKQTIHVKTCVTKSGQVNWFMVDSKARKMVVKNNKVVESRAFRTLAEKLLSARIAIKVEDWVLRNGNLTDKYFINGSVSQALAQKEFEVVIL
jgi:hypothetical protein